MELIDIILTLATVVATIFCGFITKKNPKISNKIIPIQNMIIGFIVCLVEWIITKDFSFALATSGLVAGGTYDLGHNFKKLRGE
jgi:hypothetical protein